MKSKTRKSSAPAANTPSVAVQVIQDMIERDLMLSWDFLQDGLEELALHELDNAREKILQIREIKNPVPPIASMKRLTAVNAETTHPIDNVEPQRTQETSGVGNSQQSGPQ